MDDDDESDHDDDQDDIECRSTGSKSGTGATKNLDALVVKLRNENKILKKQCMKYDSMISITSERLKCHVTTVKIKLKKFVLLVEVERFETIYMAIAIQLIDSKTFTYCKFNETIKELEQKVPSILDFADLQLVIQNIYSKLDIPVICYVQKQNKIICKKMKSGVSGSNKTLIQLFVRDTAHGYIFYTMLSRKELDDADTTTIIDTTDNKL